MESGFKPKIIVTRRLPGVVHTRLVDLFDAELTYVCAGCGEELFTSETKFDSGTGWPSYYQAINETAVEETVDNTLGMTRTEVHCRKCSAHLGHIFPDGPQPTGLRYCINSVCLDLKEK